MLSEYLERMRAGRARWENDIPARPPGLSVEASEAQQQVWLHAQLAGEIPLYNEPVTVHLEGDLDIPAFERAFNEVLRRHEAWRTVFQWRDGKLWQVVIPDLVIALPVLDLRREPARKRERLALEAATQDAKPPIDISTAPLFRPRLVWLADREFRLHLTLHHMIFDGVSLYQVFLPELQACYAAFANAKSPSLAPLSVQYPDYCLYQRRLLEGDFLKSRMDYWEQQLAGTLPELRLPLDRPRPSVRNFAGEMETFSVSRDVTQKLKEAGQLRGATSYMTFLAVFHVLLFHITGQCDQVIGSVSSSRKHEKTERLLGFFLNTIVLRTAIRPEETFLDLVSRVRGTTLDVLSYEVPFSSLVSRFGKRRNPGVSPIFQVMFSLEPPLPPLGPGWRLTQMDVETGTSKFDLYLEIDEREEGLIGRFTYACDIFDSSTIARMKEQWLLLLDTIAADPHQSIAHLSRFLSEADRARPAFMRSLGLFQRMRSRFV